MKTTTRKFKVSEFYKLAEVGVLSENERVELLDGQIMVMTPIGENYRTVVEVADASLAYDQRSKIPVYAAQASRLSSHSSFRAQSGDASLTAA